MANEMYNLMIGTLALPLNVAAPLRKLNPWIQTLAYVDCNRHFSLWVYNETSSNVSHIVRKGGHYGHLLLPLCKRTSTPIKATSKPEYRCDR